MPVGTGRSQGRCCGFRTPARVASVMRAIPVLRQQPENKHSDGFEALFARLFHQTDVDLFATAVAEDGQGEGVADLVIQLDVHLKMAGVHS